MFRLCYICLALSEVLIVQDYALNLPPIAVSAASSIEASSTQPRPGGILIVDVNEARRLRKNAKTNAWNKAQRQKNPAETKAKDHQKYLKSREKFIARTTAWAKNNAEKIRTARLKWLSENKDRVRLTGARYRAKNKTKYKRWGSMWRLRNKAGAAELDRIWKEKNRDRINALARERHSANPSRNRSKLHNYRAAIRASGGKLSPDIIPKLMRLQKGRCAACRADLTKVKFEIDHIIPVAKRGANIDSNVQLLCRPCNRSKHAKDPIQFMQDRGFLL